MIDVDVLVLREGTHGLSASGYVAELRDRLPDHTITLGQTPHEERALAAEARVISAVHLEEDLLDHAENLELFAGVAAGYDHLPLDRLADAGVVVTNASGIHAPNIAEQVLGYILSFTRNLHLGRRRQENRHWQHYQANELKGSTVTIVGLGAIGTAIAARVSAFEVETIGVRYTPEKGGPTDEVIGFDEKQLHRAYAATEYLIIASPLTEITCGLIGADAFETLPPTTYLVNVGRGAIVNTDALVSALRSNKIGGAALDVTDPEPLPRDHPLWGFENVTITPHNAGHSPQHWSRLADLVAENIEHLDRGEDVQAFRNVVRPPR